MVLSNVEVRTEVREIDDWLRAQRAHSPRLKTYESRARAALRHVGMPLPNGHGTNPESPMWKAYRAAHKAPSELHQFGVLCAQHGEGPRDVTQKSIERYFHQATKVENRPFKSALTSTRRLVKHFKDTMAMHALRVPGVRARLEPPELPKQIIADFDDWKTCRVVGGCGCTRTGLSAAKSENGALLALARAAVSDRPIGNIEDLMKPDRLQSALKILARFIHEPVRIGMMGGDEAFGLA